ncbi:30S ribosomal protein S4 [Patescibacteria group bacterium]
MNKVVSKCKICRRLGFSVCGSQKCATKRKPYPPGVHGRSRKRRRNLSEYGMQLKEKQKIRFLYGITERQFQNYVKKSLSQSKQDVSDALASLLESRLDNIVFRLGFAESRSRAHQMVGHGHITVNGRRVNIPSYKVSKDDVIKISQTSLGNGLFKNLDIRLKKHEAPSWLEVSKDKTEAKVLGKPSVDEFLKSHNIKPIIEYYSR